MGFLTTAPYIYNCAPISTARKACLCGESWFLENINVTKTSCFMFILSAFATIYYYKERFLQTSMIHRVKQFEVKFLQLKRYLCVCSQFFFVCIYSSCLQICVCTYLTYMSFKTRLADLKFMCTYINIHKHLTCISLYFCMLSVNTVCMCEGACACGEVRG